MNRSAIDRDRAGGKEGLVSRRKTIEGGAICCPNGWKKRQKVRKKGKNEGVRGTSRNIFEGIIMKTHYFTLLSLLTSSFNFDYMGEQFECLFSCS